MTDLKSGESYDTFLCKSQQLCNEPPRLVQSAGQIATERWEDDGGPLDDPPLVSVGEFARKPAWSVLSLGDLNEAIRRERMADDPARLQMESARAERARIRAVEARDEKVAAAARVIRDRYRNDWEHT